MNNERLEGIFADHKIMAMMLPDLRLSDISYVARAKSVHHRCLL